MARPRALLLALFPILTLAACPTEPDTTTATTDTSTSTAATSTSTATSTAEPTTTTTDLTTGGQTTTPDVCTSHPSGDWAACRKGGLTDAALCGWSGDVGQVSCLSPLIGGYNVCGIRDCVDDCDCFTGPITGTAIPLCQMVGASKACVLYCLNGQLCPDGMDCVSGYCYWPD